MCFEGYADPPSGAPLVKHLFDPLSTTKEVMRGGRGQHEYYILNSGGRHPLQASV